MRDLIVYKNQFVYLDDKALLSNAWAGRLYRPHDLPAARQCAADEDFDFLVSDGLNLAYITLEAKTWQSTLENPVLQIAFDAAQQRFLILTENSIIISASAGCPARSSLILLPVRMALF